MPKVLRSYSVRGEELLASDRYSCCGCLNVATGAFFLGTTGFIACIFYLLAMVLANLTYNIVPACIGLVNYAFLLTAQFSRRPCFYLVYVIINILGIAFYTLVIFFLIAMLVWMPGFYVHFVAENIERDTHTKFSQEACRNVTIVNACVYFVGILLSIYATHVVLRAYRFACELQSERSEDV